MSYNPTIKDVHDVVTKTHEMIVELFQWKGTIDQRCENRGQQIQELKDVTFGNPTPDTGLVTKVQQLSNCKKSSNQSRINTREFWRPILQRLIVWAIIAIVVFGLLLYKKHG